MRIDIITIFPEMLEGFLGQSMMKRAVEAGHVEFNCIQLRDFAEDKHRKTDDRPFGGGPGMVMKPEPMFKAVESVRTEKSRIILMCPQGEPFKQARAQELSDEEHLIFICGHYEGIDERIRQELVDEEISIGDYVLTNGVLSAAVVVDAIVRLRRSRFRSRFSKARNTRAPQTSKAWKFLRSFFPATTARLPNGAANRPKNVPPSAAQISFQGTGWKMEMTLDGVWQFGTIHSSILRI